MISYKINIQISKIDLHTKELKQLKYLICDSYLGINLTRYAHVYAYISGKIPIKVSTVMSLKRPVGQVHIFTAVYFYLIFFLMCKYNYLEYLDVKHINVYLMK